MTSVVEEFLAPKLVGERFENHSVPVELLRDLSVLEPMIVEIAKRVYLSDNPDRQRVPRGFGANVSISLSGIDPGSAVPVFKIEYSNGTLLPPGEVAYFNQAKKAVIDAVNAASTGGNITDYLEKSILSFFDKLGRSLGDDEAILLNPSNSNSPARLDKSSRQVLIDASKIVESSEETTLRGGIVEFDQDTKTCEIQLVTGQKLKAPVTEPHFKTIMTAFSQLKDNVKVAVEGVVKLDRNKRLKFFEEIEHISILEPNDVTYRLEQLRLMKDGWYGGEGIAPDKEGLTKVSTLFFNSYAEDLPQPYIYPTIEGDITAEWSVNDSFDVSLDINLSTLKAKWQELNLMDNKEDNLELDLNTQSSWEQIKNRISKLL